MPTAFPRGQCILPFHCSMECSLSSSCLSEIWGGGCETKGNTYISMVTHSQPLYWWSEPPLAQAAHRVGLSRVVPHVNVRVIEGFFYRDAALRINDQHFGQQVPCLTCCYGNGERAVLLWKQARDITSFKWSSWELITSPSGVGNVKMCSLVSVMWTLNATD